MRHCRDPTTGRCTICQKNKIIHYMEEEIEDEPETEPTPPERPSRKMSKVHTEPQSTKENTEEAGSIPMTNTKSFVVPPRPDPVPLESGVRYVTRTPSPVRQYDNVYYRDYPDNYYRDRHYNPGRTYDSRIEPRGGKGHYRDYRSYTGSRHWGRRRCLTAALVILLLLLLAGLAVGLYFAITEGQKAAQANAPQNRVINGYQGYYVNGVYVVPVTSSPGQTYLVYGNDTPCNPANNNTVTDPNFPNCNEVTTLIVPSNWTTTPSPVVVVASGSTLHAYLSVIILGIGALLLI